MSQGRLLLVDLCHSCRHLVHDDPVLLTLWLTLEVVTSPNRFDFPHDDDLPPVDHQDITFPIHLLCRDAGESIGCCYFNRTGEIIQVLPEQQLGNYNHGFLLAVRQYLQTLQCVVLGLVVQDISLLVTWRLKTWRVGGEQTSWFIRQ